MRPVLEYSGSVWDPSGVGLQNELEKVPNRAARFVKVNYNFETGSMTGILEHLNPSRNGGETADSYCYKKVWRVKPVYQQMTLVRRCRNDHYMAYQVPIANTDIYKDSFSPRPLGIGKHFQTLLSPLLKVPRMVLLSSLLWSELGTNLRGHGPG